jgi:hypothetical protein
MMPLMRSFVCLREIGALSKKKNNNFLIKLALYGHKLRRRHVNNSPNVSCTKSYIFKKNVPATKLTSVMLEALRPRAAAIAVLNSSIELPKVFKF